VPACTEQRCTDSDATRKYRTWRTEAACGPALALFCGSRVGSRSRQRLIWVSSTAPKLHHEHDTADFRRHRRWSDVREYGGVSALGWLLRESGATLKPDEWPTSRALLHGDVTTRQRIEMKRLTMTRNARSRSHLRLYGTMLRGTPENRPMRDTSKPANRNRQDEVCYTRLLPVNARKSPAGSIELNYTLIT
jgi:hypothetical protein